MLLFLLNVIICHYLIKMLILCIEIVEIINTIKFIK